MLGLFAMLLVCAALVAVASYWISWEMEHVELRPNFATKLRHDFVGLFASGHCATGMSPDRSAAT